ncbi:MAG: single-stranded-DNA-specific exonuclease RecJ [Candidatus Midichloria mitochondrii]|uniref:Single-stranded-DNA-specific exonuclease RecJ n=1 Tax=Midichloria mitochondrii (strain IricVA) TaxID=696127 RepID=F7XX06_MIDMI|nr:single-stranded-DNA-specific exonuclease RecJ [Candidatus Midichloria mitochondrii IricVA]MDJ1256512.1 single-stranded-DNA-specific exonuclease RecJ [Candidatus Midichloria mitochondrii]
MLEDFSCEGGSLYSRSAAGLSWRVLEQDDRLVAAFSQKLRVDGVVSRVLLNRGITSIEEAGKFLNGKLKSDLPNPFLFKDMEKAALRIVRAILNKEKITVLGDYDVDGATSSAVLYKFFKSIGIIIDIYIPNRLREGYGPNVEAMYKIKEKQTDLMITVDCGTSSHEPLRVAKALGMDVIVIDHHLAPTELPEAYAIINPNQLDDEFPFKTIAAVAVAFFTIIAVRKKLREINWFKDNNLNELDLMTLLDLVALGTVCDVMPLIGINRIFVRYGLHLIAQRNNLGITTVLDIAKIKSTPKAHHLGYIVGPRINAGGRVDESSLGVSLLIAENSCESYKLASQLELLNEERKNIENAALNEAFDYIEKNIDINHPVIFAVGYNWHIGVLGILASRIKEKYNKPVAVVSVNDGVGKGSARSVAGVDIGCIISAAKEKGLLIDGGGHAMAGGFTVKEGAIGDFINYVVKNLSRDSGTRLFIEQASEVIIDSVIAVRAANLSLVQALEKLGPFGNINPPPRFVIYKAKLIQVSVFSKNNLLLSITDHFYGNSSEILKCIFFRAFEKKIGQLLMKSEGRCLDLIGNLQENRINRRGVQFIVEDIILHDEKE